MFDVPLHRLLKSAHKDNNYLLNLNTREGDAGKKFANQSMAKFVPMDLLKSLKGKVCMHSDTYFANRYGTNYTGKICNPYKGEPSTAQTAQRTKFAAARAAVKALTSEQVNAYKTAFKAQRKYKSLQGYIFAQEFAKIA